MTMKTLGVAIMTLPFLVVFVVTVRWLGWKDTLGLWATAFGIIACLIGGAWLASGQ
jgi:uncharacterized membrane protein